MRTLTPSSALAVLKVGGRELRPGPELGRLTDLVGSLRRAGRALVVVHGAGEEITDRARALGLESTVVRGQRVTSRPLLEVVVEVMAGRVNARLVAALGARGVRAVGLSGASDGLLQVRPTPRLGFVGTPRSVEPRVLHELLGRGIVPVVAPLGVDRAGQLYNVNADVAAGAIAAELGAELWTLTDVPAVRDAEGSPIAALTVSAAKALLAHGGATAGMIPKLEGALAALAGGAPRVWVGDLEGLSAAGPRSGSGTLLASDPSPPGSIPLLTSRRTVRGGVQR
ncbi:MAG TPA: acetylglutamate kinase [Thermoplasmata archaeon]|nr:acetylglutamate kinase [Thermoplasmata archaeon]